MSEPFNPYHEWLGLDDAGSAPDYYQLLGIDPLKNDAEQIAAASDRALSRVRSYSPGEHARQWAELLDQLEAAKNCLTDPERKAEYDARNRDGSITESSRPTPGVGDGDASSMVNPMYPPGMGENIPGQRSAASPQTTDAQPSAESLHPTVPSSDPATQADVPAAAAPVANLVPASDVQSSAPMAIPVGGPDPMTPLFASSLAKPLPVAEVPVQPAASAAAEPQLGRPQPAEAKLRPSKAPAEPNSSWQLPIVIAMSTAALLLLLSSVYFAYDLQRPHGQQPSPIDTPTQQITGPAQQSTSTPTNPPSVEPKAASTNHSVAEPEKKPTPPSDSEPREPPEKTLATPKSDPEPPIPEPAPAKQENLDKSKLKELIELGSALATARSALGETDPEVAQEHLDLAAKLAKRPEHKLLVQRLVLLKRHVLRFHRALDAGLKDLDALDELKIKDKVAVVVELGDDFLIVRAVGRNHRYPLAQLPPILAIAIANRRLNEKAPSTKVVQGAFVAVAPNGDLKEARRLWKEAELDGADVRRLLPVLEDDYDLESEAFEKSPLPAEEKLDDAVRRVEERFQDEIARATSPPARVRLAERLLKQGQTTRREPFVRLVLWRQACNLAASAGETALMQRAIDKIAKWYQVDALQMKADALAKAAGGAAGRPAAKKIAQAALRVFDEAVEAERPELAGQLAKTAVQTAHKSRDIGLLRQANKAGTRLSKSMKKETEPAP